MNPEIKRKWVEALRSGKYTQAPGALRTAADEFCCLGVLCDLIDRGHWSTAPADDLFTYSDGTDIRDRFPPFSVLVRASLPANMARILAAMNDGGSPFPEIADYIDARL